MADTDPLPAVNVLGEPLEPCSIDPLTGFFRDGACHTCAADRGLHTVCAEVTRDFLAHSLDAGNDLVSPRPALAFPGLRPGDRWCVCAPRFLAAHEAGAAPRVHLAATHRRTLAVVPFEVLSAHAVRAS